MIKVVSHGKVYEQEKAKQEVHTYKCGYSRSTGKVFGGCGCVFNATLNDFAYTLVGHGEMDYRLLCPECGRAIYDSMNRVD